MRPSIIMPKLTPRSRRRNASGNSKCRSNFWIEARIQADFNTFYPRQSLHGSMDNEQAILGYFAQKWSTDSQLYCLHRFWQVLEVFWLCENPTHFRKFYLPIVCCPLRLWWIQLTRCKLPFHHEQYFIHTKRPRGALNLKLLAASRFSLKTNKPLAARINNYMWPVRFRYLFFGSAG